MTNATATPTPMPLNTPVFTIAAKYPDAEKLASALASGIINAAQCAAAKAMLSASERAVTKLQRVDTARVEIANVGDVEFSDGTRNVNVLAALYLGNAKNPLKRFSLAQVNALASIDWGEVASRMA